MHVQDQLRFEKVSPKKVSNFILEQLEEAITLKELLPEERLPTERDLAIMFNVSRLAVREALSQLESDGLIEKRLGAKGGTFVLPLTANSHLRNKEGIRSNWEQFRKVFEFRAVIEPEASRLAAERMTQVELNQLREYLEKSIEADCSREMFRALDVKFHLAIAKGSGNPYFENAVRQIRTKINPALDLVPYNEAIRLVNYDKHKALLDSLQARDGKAAKEIMGQHIDKSADSIYAKVFAEEGALSFKGE